MKNGKNFFCHKMSSWEKTQLKKRIYLLLNKEKIETPNINFVAEKNKPDCVLNLFLEHLLLRSVACT